MDRKKLSFVIPCYNSAATIDDVVSEVIGKTQERADEYDYEIICVNDCSPDNVMDHLRSLAADNTKIKVLSFAANKGKHTAVLAGYGAASGDYVISMDDDGQCPVNELWRLLRPLEDGHDMAMAQYEKKKEGPVKRAGSRFNHAMTRRLLRKPDDLVFTNFNARQLFVCRAMASYCNIFPYLEGLSLQVTRDVVLVPMKERSRAAGQSNFTMRKSLQLLSNGLTAFSAEPLRLGLYAGLGLEAAAGIAAAAAFLKGIGRKHTAGGSNGEEGMLAAAAALCGALMIQTGITGEYVGRTYMAVNRYPQYVIREKINL